MKQKITIEAEMRCRKCRLTAMKIAAVADGVISVAFQGEKRDQLVVIGEEVDAAGLVKSLRKKLCRADLVGVQAITDNEVVVVKERTDSEYEENEKAGGCHHHHEMELHIYDVPSSRGGCTIL